MMDDDTKLLCLLAAIIHSGLRGMEGEDRCLVAVRRAKSIITIAKQNQEEITEKKGGRK